MRKEFKLSIMALVVSAGSIAFGAQYVSSEYRASSLCSYPYSCDGETREPDYRPRLPVQQPYADSIKGNCSQIPARLSYMARLSSLTCGQADTIRSRERLAHAQEKLDENYEYLMNKNRVAAQKVLLTDYRWTEKLPFTVRENWTYKEKVGDYINCRGRWGAEGGAVESYQTTCYRRNRKEKVVQRRVRTREYCAVETPPPPPPPPASSGSSFERSSGGGSSSPTPPPIFERDLPTQPSGRGEDRDSIRNNMDEAWDSGSVVQPYFTEKYRSPAQSYRLRRLKDDRQHVKDPTPTYGCEEWKTKTEVDEDIEFDVDAEDLSYSCVRERYQWCTWYEDRFATQLCPQQKTATVNVKYVTAKDWNPSNPRYDDQLPNQFDLLLGEAEVVRVSANTRVSSLMTPNMEFANGVKGRKEPWNKYEFSANPSQIACDYKDQTINFEVRTLGRIEQAAPNPIQIPTDENGKEIAFAELDKKGRPALLNLINPGRSMVLDRSNLSRIFGVSEETQQDPKMVSSKISIEKPARPGGISKKFWEDTRFWMRLVWKDGKTTVKVTRPVEFDLNKAQPVGDNLTVSLTGQYGMEKFYKLSVPLESVFGFLGGDASLDPKKEYYLEMKIAQPGFDGIYKSGLAENVKNDGEQAVVKKDAYSESKLVRLKASDAKPGLIERFWHWRSRRMMRP